MLCEEGKVELDAPASAYMPEFSRMKVTVAPDAEEITLIGAERDMTVRDLYGTPPGYPVPTATHLAKLQSVSSTARRDFVIGEAQYDTWSTLADMPTARTDAPTSTVKRKIYVIGARQNGTDLTEKWLN